METAALSRAAPGHDNEDTAVTGDGFAFVLDGATADPGDPGCRHGVRWYVRHLAGALSRQLARPDTGPVPLTDLLGAAIAEVRLAHGGDCDLANPRSPSATVVIVRERPEGVDHLVLGDSVLLLGEPEDVTAVVDDRLRAYDDLEWALLHRYRNVPGGFWVAGAEPDAATKAVTGTVPPGLLRWAGLVTDGVTRLVDRYGWSWRRLLDTLDGAGPAALVDAVRRAEHDTPPGAFAGKHHDDATAVLCRFW